MVLVVEREEDLERLRSAFEKCRDGCGSVVVVNGGVGSGKTTLIRSFLDAARLHGATVLSAAGSRSEGAFPLGLVRQWFASGPALSFELGRITRLAQDHRWPVDPDGDESFEGATTTAAAIHEVTDAILALGEHRPLVVAVDDVHHADYASLLCLSHLVRRVAGAPVLVLLGECVDVRPTHLFPHAELMRCAEPARVQLRPLTERSVAALLAPHVGAERGVELAPSVHDASQGNPLLVTALIEDAVAAGPSLGPAPIGAAFDRAVLGALCRFDQDTTRVAQAMAVLPEPAAWTVAPQVLEFRAQAVGEARLALERAGLVRSGTYHHERTRLVVLNTLTARETADLHERAAELLYQRNASASAVAPHVLESTTVLAPWAAPLLQDAADEALAVADLTSAQDYYLRLMTGAENDQRTRSSARLRLMSTEWWINPAIAKRHLGKALDAAHAGDLTEHQRCTLADHLLWHGRPDEALALVDQLDDGTSASCSRIGFRLAMQYVYPQYATRWPRQTADPADDLAHAMKRLHGTPKFTDPALSAALRVLGAARLSPTHLPAGCDDVACPPICRAVDAALRAMAARQEGELDAAQEWAQAALSAITTRGWGIAVGLPLAVAVDAALDAGHVEVAARHVDVPVPVEMFRTAFGVGYLESRARYHEHVGRHEEAVEDRAACLDLACELGVSTDSVESMVLRAGGHGPQAGAVRPIASRRLLVEPRIPDRPADGSMGLSEAEQRVADLVVVGDTNRAIASKLFITESTVEQHLTRIYRKLGVGGRRAVRAHLLQMA